MRYEDRLIRVLTYIHDNPTGDLSLDTLADVAAMSRFHWQRVYFSMTGETCVQAVRRMRLHRAAGMLVREDTAVDAIGRACGYGNARSFAQAFRGAYGMTPLSFRKLGQVDRPALTLKSGDGNMFDVELRTAEARKLIGFAHKGSYMGIGEKFEQALAVISARNLWPNAGPMLGVYRDDPNSVAEADLRSFAGIEWRGETVPEGFEALDVAGGRMGVLTYKGPYATLSKAYDWLYGEWLATSGEEPADAPCFEIYVNNPRETAPEELLTEIYLPLK